jgi:hypothetical protein
MLEEKLYHVLLVKEDGTNNELLVHTSSIYSRSVDWVKEHGCKYHFIEERYYFKITSAIMNLPYIAYNSGRELAFLTMQGNTIDLFDVWLVHTKKDVSGNEDKLAVEGLTRVHADEYINLKHFEADEPVVDFNSLWLHGNTPTDHVIATEEPLKETLLDRSELWNYFRVPNGFKPAKGLTRIRY